MSTNGIGNQVPVVNTTGVNESNSASKVKTTDRLSTGIFERIKNAFRSLIGYSSNKNVSEKPNRFLQGDEERIINLIGVWSMDLLAKGADPEGNVVGPNHSMLEQAKNNFCNMLKKITLDRLFADPRAGLPETFHKEMQAMILDECIINPPTTNLGKIAIERIVKNGSYGEGVAFFKAFTEKGHNVQDLFSEKDSSGLMVRDYFSELLLSNKGDDAFFQFVKDFNVQKLPSVVVKRFEDICLGKNGLEFLDLVKQADANNLPAKVYKKYEKECMRMSDKDFLIFCETVGKALPSKTDQRLKILRDKMSDVDFLKATNRANLDPEALVRYTTINDRLAQMAPKDFISVVEKVGPQKLMGKAKQRINEILKQYDQIREENNDEEFLNFVKQYGVSDFFSGSANKMQKIEENYENINDQQLAGGCKYVGAENLPPSGKKKLEKICRAEEDRFLAFAQIVRDWTKLPESARERLQSIYDRSWAKNDMSTLDRVYATMDDIRFIGNLKPQDAKRLPEGAKERLEKYFFSMNNTEFLVACDKFGLENLPEKVQNARKKILDEIKSQSTPPPLPPRPSAGQTSSSIQPTATPINPQKPSLSKQTNLIARRVRNPQRPMMSS